MKRTNGGAQWWSEDKSFYLALMLCLAAIAVAAYLLFAFPNGTSDDDTMQAQEYQADDSVTASEALERIPAMDPQPAPEQEETQQETDTADPAEQPEQQPADALSFAPPMDSKITQDFSQNTLLYNETTGDWRTHEAVDYEGKSGDAVQAAAAGTVLAVGGGSGSRRVYDHQSRAGIDEPVRGTCRPVCRGGRCGKTGAEDCRAGRTDALGGKTGHTSAFLRVRK